jgi:hypothetical protein
MMLQCVVITPLVILPLQIVALCCAPSAIVADATGFPDASSPCKFDVRLIIVHHLVTLICFVSYPSLACQFLLLA